MGGVSNPPVAANPDLAIWNAAKIQGRDVAGTAPNDGDVYVWSAANNRFEPAAVAGGAGGSVQWSNIQGDKNYGDLVGKPNLDNFVTALDIAGLATEQALIALAQSIPDTSQFLTSVGVSDVNGLQSALNAKVGLLFGVNFAATGGVITIKSQQNVSAIVRPSLGRYRIEYANNAPNTNYLIFAFAGFNNVVQNPYMTSPQGMNLSDWKQLDSVTVEYSYANVARNIDPDEISVIGIAL